MFNEQAEERNRQGQRVPVWQTPKYKQSRTKALEIMKEFSTIEEGDFWILKNEVSGGAKMAYTGLIISHNGCLKLNEAMPEGKKFLPECVTLDKDGYGGALVFTYMCQAQGLYEVGEVTAKNCKNAYPYAMALKRCFDRVVLKLSKLAYSGVYSDSEAEEFRAPEAAGPEGVDLAALIRRKGYTVAAICRRYKVNSLDDLSDADYFAAIDNLNKLKDKAK